MEVKILHKQGLSIREISRRLGMCRKTIRKYLVAETSPSYRSRLSRASKLSPYHSYLQERIQAAAPDWLPGTVLYRECQAQGYEGGIAQLRRYISQLKASQSPQVLRFETEPGQQLQVDWAEFQRKPERISAFVSVLGYSRMSYVEFVANETIETLLSCLSHAFNYFAGVPKHVLFDNMKTVVLQRDHYGEGQHRYHPMLWDFAHHHGFVPKLCRPYRACTKGKVERFIRYLRGNFYIPLKTRLAQAGLTIDVTTANSQVEHWLQQTANQRLHQTTGDTPWHRWHQHEKMALMPEPMPYQGSTLRQQVTPSTEVPGYSSVPLQHNLDTYQQTITGA